MRRIIVLILLIIPILVSAQIYDRGIYYANTDSNSVVDTLAVSDDSLSTVVYWSGWRSMRGSLTIYGEAWLLSGGTRTLTVNLKHLNDINPNDLGTSQTLGTIVVADSTKYEYNVSGQSWWHLAKGYEISFVPDSTTSQVRIKGKELAK